MSFEFFKKGDGTILYWTFGHAAVGFMFGLIGVMIPWFIFVAPQIMTAHSKDIPANRYSGYIFVVVFSITIVWRVAKFLKQFGMRAMWYGFVAWIASIVFAVPFMMFSGLFGRRYNHQTLSEIFAIIKDPGEIIYIGLVIGFYVGTLLLLSGIIAAIFSKRK